MAYGLQNEGFFIKRLQDILTEQRSKAVELFQDLLESGDIVDTSDSSALGRLITLDADGDASLWEVAQQAYLAFDPNSATGIALDNLVQYTGISRIGNTYSTSRALFGGDNGTLIQANNVVSAPVSGNQFNVANSVALNTTGISEVTIVVNTVSNLTAYTITYTTGITSTSTVTYTSDASATTAEILAGLANVITISHPLLIASVSGNTLIVNKADVFNTSTFTFSGNLTPTKVKKLGELIAVEFGNIEQASNTITNIVTPVLGWDSITNPEKAVAGQFTETDEELRIRFRETKLERSSNILDSLYSAILNVEGVEEVTIYENDTDVTDSNGVTAHSFLPVVLGGSSQTIGETIWKNKPMGISSEGNTTITLTDSQGFSREISFERPDPVTIYVYMQLTVNNEIFPGTGEDDIKSAIINYATDEFGVGDDVIYSRMYTPINTVPGHQVNILLIGTDPFATTMDNIPIAFNEISSFESVNIAIDIV